MTQDLHQGDAPPRTVIAVNDLTGRTVWTDDGERIGVVRDVIIDGAGRVTAFDVRERWIFGPHHRVEASGMRMDGGDVVVPSGAVRAVESGRDEADASRAPASPAEHVTSAPLLLAGRHGARGRFGGIDLAGSLIGALVAFGALVLVGGLLTAIFESEATVVDTSFGTFALVTSDAMLVGAVTAIVAFFLGGWAAGRSARFDGALNGVFVVLWVLGIALLLGALGAWLGDEYDVWVATDLPTYVTDEFALWGSVAFVATFVLMLAAAAVGGGLGERWHRRADRAMLDVVAVDSGADQSTGQVGSPVEPQPVDEDATPRR